MIYKCVHQTEAYEVTTTPHEIDLLELLFQFKSTASSVMHNTNNALFSSTTEHTSSYQPLDDLTCQVPPVNPGSQYRHSTMYDFWNCKKIHRMTLRRFQSHLSVSRRGRSTLLGGFVIVWKFLNHLLYHRN